MLEFEWEWIFLLLPLPFLARILLTPVKRVEQAPLRVPFAEDFLIAGREPRRRFAGRFFLWLAFVGWLLLITAAARPQWVGEIARIPSSGRDLMLALDLSGSMDEKDFVLNANRVNRLTAAKDVAGDFIEKRRGDRIGLVVFGEKPYLMMPLSFDLDAVQSMLAETFIGLAGANKTAIGDAIMLSLKRFREKEHSNRVLILLTDGSNNTGKVTPEEAVEFARQEDMKIYTIGVGSDVVRQGFFSMPNSELDEKTLRMIADKTDGRYFRAKDTAGLRRIYALLDQLEPIERDAEFFQTRSALYPYPLAAALLTAVVLLLAFAMGRIAS